MANLTSRLDALRPKIEQLMRIGGTPGLSLSVMHHGDEVYYSVFGYRDVEARLSPTEETVLPVYSLTKAVTSAALAVLVEEKKVKWDTLIKDVLPTFNINDETLQNSLTVTDILCHRSGMSWADNLVVGTENNILVGGKDAMAYINSQTRLLPFRGQFPYNNMGYELAGKVIEALSGQSYFDFFQSRIFALLGMTRTFLVTPPSSLENVGKCYNALDNSTAAQIHCVKAGDDWFCIHASMRTCVKDLMKLYKALMVSFNDQFATGKSSTEGSPLKQVTELMSAKIPIDQPSRNEASYGLGWDRVQLPGKMGQIGINEGLMPEGMPVVGKGVAPRLVIFHQGSLPGALSLVMLLPDTESAIVILSNALALNDVPDWVGQLILEELLEVPDTQRNDYIAAAKTSRAENLKWVLTSYEGTYWDPLHIFKIVVAVEGNELYWALQGLESEKFRLSHYEDDVFTWLQTRNELSRRGRWVGPDQGPGFWKIEFKVDGKGQPNRLYWAHDNGVPAVKYLKE